MEEKEIAYFMQGDQSYKSTASRAEREAVKKDIEVVKYIDKFWGLFFRHDPARLGDKGDGELKFSQFEKFYLRVFKFLDESYNEEECRSMAWNEWRTETAGVGAMGYTQFSQSVLELVDMWTVSTRRSEYRTFVQKLFEGITGPDPHAAENVKKIRVEGVVAGIDARVWKEICMLQYIPIHRIVYTRVRVANSEIANLLSGSDPDPLKNWWTAKDVDCREVFSQLWEHLQQKPSLMAQSRKDRHAAGKNMDWLLTHVNGAIAARVKLVKQDPPPFPDFIMTIYRTLYSEPQALRQNIIVLMGLLIDAQHKDSMVRIFANFLRGTWSEGIVEGVMRAIRFCDALMKPDYKQVGYSYPRPYICWERVKFLLDEMLEGFSLAGFKARNTMERHLLGLELLVAAEEIDSEQAASVMDMAPVERIRNKLKHVLRIAEFAESAPAVAVAEEAKTSRQIWNPKPAKLHEAELDTIQNAMRKKKLVIKYQDFLLYFAAELLPRWPLNHVTVFGRLFTAGGDILPTYQPRDKKDALASAMFFLWMSFRLRKRAQEARDTVKRRAVEVATYIFNLMLASATLPARQVEEFRIEQEHPPPSRVSTCVESEADQSQSASIPSLSPEPLAPEVQDMAVPVRAILGDANEAKNAVQLSEQVKTLKQQAQKKIAAGGSGRAKFEAFSKQKEEEELKAEALRRELLRASTEVETKKKKQVVRRGRERQRPGDRARSRSESRERSRSNSVTRSKDSTPICSPCSSLSSEEADTDPNGPRFRLADSDDSDYDGGVKGFRQHAISRHAHRRSNSRERDAEGTGSDSSGEHRRRTSLWLNSGKRGPVSLAKSESPPMSERARVSAASRQDDGRIFPWLKRQEMSAAPQEDVVPPRIYVTLVQAVHESARDSKAHYYKLLQTAQPFTAIHNPVPGSGQDRVTHSHAGHPGHGGQGQGARAATTTAGPTPPTGNRMSGRRPVTAAASMMASPRNRTSPFAPPVRLLSQPALKINLSSDDAAWRRQYEWEQEFLEEVEVRKSEMKIGARLVKKMCPFADVAHTLQAYGIEDEEEDPSHGLANEGGAGGFGVTKPPTAAWRVLKAKGKFVTPEQRETQQRQREIQSALLKASSGSQKAQKLFSKLRESGERRALARLELHAKHQEEVARTSPERRAAFYRARNQAREEKARRTEHRMAAQKEAFKEKIWKRDPNMVKKHMARLRASWLAEAGITEHPPPPTFSSPYPVPAPPQSKPSPRTTPQRPKDCKATSEATPPPAPKAANDEISLAATYAAHLFGDANQLVDEPPSPPRSPPLMKVAFFPVYEEPPHLYDPAEGLVDDLPLFLDARVSPGASRWNVSPPRDPSRFSTPPRTERPSRAPPVSATQASPLFAPAPPAPSSPGRTHHQRDRQTAKPPSPQPKRPLPSEPRPKPKAKPALPMSPRFKKSFVSGCFASDRIEIQGSPAPTESTETGGRASTSQSLSYSPMLSVSRQGMRNGRLWSAKAADRAFDGSGKRVRPTSSPVKKLPSHTKLGPGEISVVVRDRRPPSAGSAGVSIAESKNSNIAWEDEELIEECSPRPGRGSSQGTEAAVLESRRPASGSSGVTSSTDSHVPPARFRRSVPVPTVEETLSQASVALMADPDPRPNDDEVSEAVLQAQDVIQKPPSLPHPKSKAIGAWLKEAIVTPRRKGLTRDPMSPYYVNRMDQITGHRATIIMPEDSEPTLYTEGSSPRSPQSPHSPRGEGEGGQDPDAQGGFATIIEA